MAEIGSSRNIHWIGTRNKLASFFFAEHLLLLGIARWTDEGEFQKCVGWVLQALKAHSAFACTLAAGNN